MNWEEANAYCIGDWRLPNIDELITLIRGCENGTGREEGQHEEYAAGAKTGEPTEQVGHAGPQGEGKEEGDQNRGEGVHRVL